jgi:hypothetical protein
MKDSNSFSIQNSLSLYICTRKGYFYVFCKESALNHDHTCLDSDVTSVSCMCHSYSHCHCHTVHAVNFQAVRKSLSVILSSTLTLISLLSHKIYIVSSRAYKKNRLVNVFLRHQKVFLLLFQPFLYDVSFVGVSGAINMCIGCPHHKPSLMYCMLMWS